jgi:intracellular sulfur oxidation DsrE/DsrF family protein
VNRLNLAFKHAISVVVFCDSLTFFSTKLPAQKERMPAMAIVVAMRMTEATIGLMPFMKKIFVFHIIKLAAMF